MNILTQQNGAADYCFAKNSTFTITIIFLIGAVFGINSWPYQALVHNSNQSIISLIFGTFTNFSISFLLLFLHQIKSLKRSTQFRKTTGFHIQILLFFYLCMETS